MFLHWPQLQDQEVSSALKATSTNFTHRPSSAVELARLAHNRINSTCVPRNKYRKRATCSRTESEEDDIMAQIPSNPLKKMELINAIQRLGMSRHFENEIDQVLLQIHNNSYECYHHRTEGRDDDDLHIAALYFRSLRQQGYYISCGKFSVFMAC
ncbi:hypothetical protein ACFXTO_031006 [Malus domestica]